MIVNRSPIHFVQSPTVCYKIKRRQSSNCLFLGLFYMAWILWQIVYWWKVLSVSGFLPRSHHFTKTILIRIAGKSRFHLKQLFFTRVQNFTKILRLFEHFSVFTDSKSPTSNVRQTKKIGRHDIHFSKQNLIICNVK